MPVRISGTFEILPRSSVALKPGTARIAFGHPIPTAGLTYEDREALMLRCRAAIEELGEGGRGEGGSDTPPFTSSPFLPSGYNSDRHTRLLSSPFGIS